jgi:hypothetical protein
MSMAGRTLSNPLTEATKKFHPWALDFLRRGQQMLYRNADRAFRRQTS